MAYTFLLNAKAYATGVGDAGRILFQLLESAQRDYPHVQIIYAPQAPYLSYKSNTDLLLVAQHSDAISYGPHTGYLLPEALADLGCFGSLINHSEHPLSKTYWQEHIVHLKKLGLRSICCARDLNEVAMFAHLGADYIALEPEELIGSTTSVSDVFPNLIEEASRTAQKSVLLAGAGIQSTSDIQRAILLGANGVLVSSSIMNKPTDKEHLYSLLDGFPRT